MQPFNYQDKDDANASNLISLYEYYFFKRMAYYSCKSFHSFEDSIMGLLSHRNILPFFFQNICDARLLELVDKVQACLDHNALFISLVRLNPKPPYIFGCRRIWFQLIGCITWLCSIVFPHKNLGLSCPFCCRFGLYTATEFETDLANVVPLDHDNNFFFHDVKFDCILSIRNLKNFSSSSIGEWIPTSAY